MKIGDFSYMRRGKNIRSLNLSDHALLQTIDIKGSGSDKALLLLHGFASSPAVFRYLVPKIENYDAILCPLIAGHGQSIEAFAHSNTSEWLDSAVKAYESLSQNYASVDVVGLSMGGLLACLLSQQYPLHHLILLAPAFKLHMHIKWYIRLCQVLKTLGFKYFRANAGNVLSDEHSEIALRQLPLTSILEMLRFVDQFKWEPPACPTDVFLGAHDNVVDSQAIEPLFSNLPNVNLHWLKNSAHLLPMDNEMDAIVQCINAIK